MSLTEPVPQRLSDGERDAAISALRTHFELGRLNHDEFSERMQVALAARTASDLGPLFSDLPAPHPLFLSAAQPTWNTYPGVATTATASAAPEPGSPTYPYPAFDPSYSMSTPAVSGEMVPYSGHVPAVRSQPGLPSTMVPWVRTLQAVIWPLAILLLVVGNTGIWPIFVAIIISSLLGVYRRSQRTPPPY